MNRLKQDRTQMNRLKHKENTTKTTSTAKFGRGSLLKNQFYYFKDPSLPFIWTRTGHLFTKKLAREALQGSLLTFPILAPKWRVKRHLLDVS